MASLQRIALMDVPAEPHLDRITALVARVLRVETALLSLVDADRQFFASGCGLPEPYATTRQTPHSHSFCKYVVKLNQPFVVSDARLDPRVSENGAVTDIGVVSYVGVPVRDRDGRVLGSLCAIGGTAREWTPHEINILTGLAAIVEDEIELRLEALRARALAIENGILAREYHHRVKNALAVSAALVKLSAKDATSVEDLVKSAGSRLTALASAHDALIVDTDNIDLKNLALRLLQPYATGAQLAQIEGADVTLGHDQVTPICLFLHELATNSAKYGAFSKHGTVNVSWTHTPSGDIDLFWTEGTDTSHVQPQGFGSKLMEVAARQLRGRCQITAVEDRLTAHLIFPASEQNSPSL
ncbi:MAG: HWE histidine kinase domain-containing protein [Hyphomicrobiaceae bacterium]|nr:HWE histidine kinase domain-containing protein [Hyphomicrobiaceae bacterium]